MEESLTIREMPRSNDAEQSVLGSILIDPACLPAVQRILSPQDFYLPQHQAVFAVMEGLAARNKAIDPLVVINSLEGHEDYNADWRNYLFQVARATPSAANAESYAQIVRDKARARTGIVLAEEIASALYAAADFSVEMQNKAGELLQLLSGANQQKVFSFSQLLARFAQRMNEPVKHISTGMGKLDQFIMIEPGDYVVVGGRPSSGKTAFTLQMMLQMVRAHRVAYFSLETNEDKITDRMVSNRSGVDFRSIKRHDLDYDDRVAIAEALEEYKTNNGHVIAAAGWTVEKVRAAALQLRAEVIFVDYLGLLVHGGKTLYERVTEISKGLRTLAENTDITVVALSQLSRSGVGEDAELHHLRESGQIEQDADIALLISPVMNGKVPVPDRRNLRIGKNKEGEANIFIELRFDGAKQQFSVIDESLDVGTYKPSAEPLPWGQD